MNNDHKSDFRLDQSTISNGLFTVIERKPLSSLENNDSLNISNLSDPLNISIDYLSKKKENNTANDNVCEIYRLNSSQILNDNLDNTVSRVSYVDDDVSSFYDSEKEEELYFDNDISTLGSCYSFTSAVKNSKKKKSRNSVCNSSSYKNVPFEGSSENNSPFNKLKDNDTSNECNIEESYIKENYSDNRNGFSNLKFPEDLKNEKDDLSESKNSDLSNEDLLNSNSNDEKAIRLNKNIYRIVNINKADKDNKESFIRRITQIRKSMMKEKNYEDDKNESKLNDLNNLRNESNVISNKEKKNYKNYNRFSEGFILKKYNNLSRYNSDKKIKYRELNHEGEEDSYFEENFDEYNNSPQDSLYYDYVRKYKINSNNQFKNDMLKIRNEEDFHKRRRNECDITDYNINENIYCKNFHNSDKRLKECDNNNNITNNRRILKDLNHSYSDEKELFDKTNKNMNHLRFKNKFPNNYEEYYNSKKQDDYYVNARIKRNSSFDKDINKEKYSDDYSYNPREKYIKNNHYINKKNPHYNINNTYREENNNKSYYNNMYNNLTDEEYKNKKFIYNKKDPNSKNIMKNEVSVNEQMKKTKFIYKNNSNNNVVSGNEMYRNEEIYENEEGNTYFKTLQKKGYNKTDNEDIHINDNRVKNDENNINDIYRKDRYVAPNQNFENDYVLYEKKYIDEEQNDENVKMKKSAAFKHIDEEKIYYKNNFIEYGSNNNNYGIENNANKKISYGNITNNEILENDDINNNPDEKDLFYYKERNNLINNNENNKKHLRRNDYFIDKNEYHDNYENKNNKYLSKVNSKYKNDSYMYNNNNDDDDCDEYYNKKYTQLKSNDHLNTNFKNINYEYNNKASSIYNRINERNNYGDMNYRNNEMHLRQNSADYLNKKDVYDQYENNEEQHNSYNNMNIQSNYNIKNTGFNENQDQENMYLSKINMHRNAGIMNYNEEFPDSKNNVKILNENRIDVNDEKKREENNQGNVPISEEKTEENAKVSINGNANNEIGMVENNEEKEKLNDFATGSDLQKEILNKTNIINNNISNNLVQNTTTTNNIDLLNKQNKDQPPVKRKRGRPKLKKTSPEEVQQTETNNNAPSYQAANQNLQANNFSNLNNNIINDLNQPLYNNMNSVINPAYNTQMPHTITTHLNQPLDQQINQQMNQALGQPLNYQLAPPPPPQTLNHQLTDPLNQLHQPLVQPLNQQINQQINQQLSSQMDQQMTHQMNHALNQQLNIPLNIPLNRQINQQPLNHPINSQLDQQMNNPINQQLNHPLNQQINAQLDQQMNQQLNMNLNPSYNHQHMYNNNNNLNKQLNPPMYVIQNRMNNNFNGNANEEQYGAMYNNYDKEITNNIESNYYRNIDKIKNNNDDFSYEGEEEFNKRNARSTVSESEEKDSEREFKKIHKKRGRRRKKDMEQINENKTNNNNENKSSLDSYKNNTNNDNSKNELKTDPGYSTFVDENNKTVSYRVSYHPADAVWEKISGVKFGPMILTAQSRTTNVILSKKRSIELGNILHNLIYGYIYKGDNVRLTIGKESKNVKSGSPFFLPSFNDCSIHNDDESGSAKIFLCFVYLN